MEKIHRSFSVIVGSNFFISTFFIYHACNQTGLKGASFFSAKKSWDTQKAFLYIEIPYYADRYTEGCANTSADGPRTIC